MLQEFVKTEGNDATVLQDQHGIICGIIMQSAAQKKCFQEWGDCLLMDRTHGTNNLGYHLGK
ncbi:hypothetical protein PHYSODRAFT_499306 [Phytophthora sojae]|uniref:ZSWIM1/3 RNaseH-like domain-containing protein n=1 Tax=Phytophthora sojae (strain P6497) TaxID=1094619 RepID=G4ZEE2_PHYSP|nr:hypothetical protein PHYSODRAFT_499306 [Phytophthora sojae]EGZ18407.1 hypothetical protein PHYSODRAFT_499306 [Phytophthora sojae]|eukprot:XP_009527465.1 hypothetical protein PHYSODRAFT_499306 [Phytophthora sojae]